ncbi:hypothetical protein, partial [Nocardia sp. NPDC006630]|uniref:hypothetical protein n=1 Tax=Nocardia sp. NPDC006630 TaxID=3157181 RepID=UPI0033BA6921
MALGAVRERPAATDNDGTPGVVETGEMSARTLVLMLVLSLGMVFLLVGGSLRAGLGGSGDGADTPATPGSSSKQHPASAGPPPPAAPA